jgi:hypothetical protein
LDKVWKDEDFIDLLPQQVRGKVGTHSLWKFPTTWASAEHGATDPEIEIRGHWKGSKNGRIVNRYISVEQLTTDTKVAGILCIGGPVKYVAKTGSNVTRAFLVDMVCPRIANFFPEEHNKIAEVLALPLLWLVSIQQHNI